MSYVLILSHDAYISIKNPYFGSHLVIWRSSCIAHECQTASSGYPCEVIPKNVFSLDAIALQFWVHGELFITSLP